MNNLIADDFRKSPNFPAFLIVILLVIIILVLLLCRSCGQTELTDTATPDSNGIVWDGEKQINNTYESNSISIPGFTEMTFAANTTRQSVNLYNPDNNFAIMDMSIVLDDGTELWHEKNIHPGYGFHEITINRPLERGNYAAKLVVSCTDVNGASLNGGVIKFNLHVK